MGSTHDCRADFRADSFVVYVLDQLREVERLGCRAMFGGHGLYSGPTFFGIVFDGRIYFKTDERTEGEFTRRGMGPFRANDKQLLRTYYEVPPDVLEDRDALAAWADAAARCAAAARASSPRNTAAAAGRGPVG